MDELFTNIDWAEIWQATQDTLAMLGWSMLFTLILGLPLGVLLFLTSRRQLLEQPLVYGILSFVVNVLRSVPFIILMVAIVPLTRAITGTSIGTTAALVPLTIYIAPFIARLIEASLLEVGPGILEAAESMGATMWQTIRWFMLPEARASIILALTTSTVGLIGATAMAGTIGGGGVGDLAISYGYQQFDTFAMLATVIILIIVVQGIQSLGNWLARRARD